MEPPVCGNYTSGTCERNEVYVEKETDQGYVIRCRCCRSISFWPHNRDEKFHRYNAYLKRQADETEKQKIWERRPFYSFDQVHPGGK